MTNKVKIENAIKEIEKIYNIDLCHAYLDFKKGCEHLTTTQFKDLYVYENFQNIFKSLNEVKSLLVGLNK
jgi:hypothetical protein